MGVFVYMRHHVGNDVSDMSVVQAIENLFAAALGAKQAGGAQQAQVMADERGREAQRRRDVANRLRAIQRLDDDAQARGVAEQAEHLGEFDGFVVGEWRKGKAVDGGGMGHDDVLTYEQVFIC